MRQLKRQVIVQLLKQHQYTYPNASSVHCSHELKHVYRLTLSQARFERLLSPESKSQPLQKIEYQAMKLNENIAMLQSRTNCGTDTK